ncbi:MAG: hypothetical protein LUE87_08010, partial [Lachnospiraceae bacterium]|nr:hypothetical protein [Lachnospiraceae bacterium]
MHHKKIRLLFGLVVTSTVIFAASGCAQPSSTTEDQAEQTEYASAENTFVYTDDTDEELVSTTLTGTVESIDGNEITLNVGMGGSRGQEGGMDGDMPSDMAEGEMPNMSGDSSGKPQDGEAPDAGGEGGNGVGNSEAGQGGAQPGNGISDTEGSGAPETPDGNTSDAEGSEAPEMPDGDTSDTEDSEAPENPDGEASGAEGSAPSEQPQGENGGGEGSENQPDGDIASVTQGVLTVGDESVILVETEDGETQSGSLEDITEGSMLQITFDEDGVITEVLVSSGMGGNNMQGGMGGDMQSGMSGSSGQSSSSSVSYSAVNEYTEDSEITGETITSTGTDENAVLVSDGASVSFQNVTVERSSSDSTGGDNSSFYGVGAAMLVTDGTLTVSDSTITTDAAGGAGVFAYGDGTAYVLDTASSTSQDTSGGIHVAGGGTLYAWDLTVETDGESAAAIRSDRGGGTLVVDGGTYTSNGEGSPALYCTADIAVNGAVLTATGSEAICMEGLNTIHLFDCDITGNMSDLSQNDTTWTVIVYQSMSGDSEVGTSTMQIIGGTLTSENGGIFYTTNTESEI